MQLKSPSNLSPAARKVLARLMLTCLALALLVAGALPALAQDTAYTDPAGVFTATIPATWADESTADYGLFTNSGVSFYLLSVGESEIQAGVDAAIAVATPDLASGTPNVMGEFAAPSGTWTQIIYMLSGGAVGNVVAQSNGSATVILIVTADSMAAMQAILGDANAILASISIEGAMVAEQEAPESAVPAAPPVEGDLYFPELTGDYAVGRVDYLWRDDSRVETNGDPHVVRVWFWYPAAPNADSAVAPYLPDGMNEVLQREFGIRSSQIHSHAYDAAPVLSTDSGYPVVLAGPGNGYNAAFSTALAEEIASHGYVVVGYDHAYNSFLTTLPDGTVIRRPSDNLQETDELFASRIGDVEFVLDQLAQVNSSDAILQGSLDLDHIGIWGHSFGGQTAGEVCRVDARCTAVAISDVPLRGELATSGVSKPIMLLDAEILSGEDWLHEQEVMTGQTIPDADLIADFWDSQNAARNATAEMLLAASPDAYRVGISGARHNDYSDTHLLATLQPAMLPLMGGISTIDAVRGQQVIGDYLLAFFDTYLKGAPAPLLDGASADYPEVTFVRGQS